MKTRDQALTDVLAERTRQDAKWGEQNHDPITYLAILTEQVTYTTGIVVMNGYATAKITATMTPEAYRTRYAIWFQCWRETGTQFKFEYFKK